MKNTMVPKIKIISLAVVLSFGISYVYAWTAPTTPPPSGNVSAPINTGDITQTKTGGLNVATVSGNFGVGTATPSEKFEVAGTIKATGLQLPTGAAVNKMLTSDASGNVAWTDRVGMPLLPTVYWSNTTVNFVTGVYDIIGCGGSGGYGYTNYTIARSIGGCAVLKATTLSGPTSVTIGSAGVDWVWAVIGQGGGATFIGATRLGGGGGSGGYFTQGGNGNGTYGGLPGGYSPGWSGNAGAGGAPNGATTIIQYNDPLIKLYAPTFGDTTGGVVLVWGPY